MTHFVQFRTPGAIELEALTTFGVSAKDPNNKNPIGFFGTGFKYAVAVILREGGDVTITMPDGTRYPFGVQPKTIRDKDFDLVTFDGKPLGFTTELGKKWEMWMAYRELYSNTIDESGVVTHGRASRPAFPEETCIEVSNSQEFHRVHTQERNEIFFTEPDLTLENFLAIRDEPSNYVYYRGVRALRLQRPSLLTYNILYDTDLTEDRTFKSEYTVNRRLCMALGMLPAFEKDMVRKLVTCPERNFEYHLDFSSYDLDKDFTKTIRELMDDGVRINLNILKAYRASDAAIYHPCELTPFEQDTIERALEFLREMNITIPDGITYTKDLPPGVMGCVRQDKIYISVQDIDKGEHELAATLLEEILHYTTGHGDFSREFQTHILLLAITQGRRAAAAERRLKTMQKKEF